MQNINLTTDFEKDAWHLARIIRRDAPWNIDNPVFPVRTFYEALRDGTGVDIYCVDSGTDTTHAETLGRVTNVYNYFGTDGVHNGDDHGHGTATASHIAGNTLGTARGSLLWTFKIYSSSGSASQASVQECLTRVLEHYNSRAATGRPAVVMANFGININVSAYINPLIDAGMVVVCSAHNFGQSLTSNALYPAVMDDVVAVGGISACDSPYRLGNAADSTGAPQIGTNYGPQIDILAPAQSIKVANASKLGGGYRIHSGNSYSTPLTAGVLACMLQGHARLTTRAQVQAVIAKLLANATTGRFRTGYGYDPLPDRILYLDPAISFETF